MTREREVDEGRRRIDAWDADIVGLLAARGAESARVQAARRAAGGGQVEPGREAVVVERYVAALGPAGADIARAVLQLCRGPLPPPQPPPLPLDHHHER